MKVGAVIVAAGRGERLGGERRKAMVALGGRPLLLHSVERLHAARSVEQIVIVAHALDIEELEEGPHAAFFADHGVTHFVAGGERRQDSALNGLRALSSKWPGCLVHDAARPFCSPGLIDRIATTLDTALGAIPVVRVASTVKRVAGDEHVLGTVDRSYLRLAQTPQGGRRKELIDAFEIAQREGYDVTDEAQAMERAHMKVATVDDSNWNFKITTREDLELAELVLAKRPWEFKT